MHIAIVGAGIVGLTTARALMAAGHRVTVIDRASGPAMGASGQNGAQLSYAFVAPLASPAVPAQVPRLLLDADSPLRLRPGLSPDIWLWCVQFMAACRPGRADRTTRTLLALAARSRTQFDRWREASPSIDAIDHERNGKLVIYRSSSSLEAAATQLALQAPHGPAQAMFTAAQCLSIEPALGVDANGITGGVWTPSEEVADCASVCRALADELWVQPGCRFVWGGDALRWEREGSVVRGLRVRQSGGERTIAADAFVVAAGAATPSLLRPLGARPSIQPLKGYSIDLPADRVVRMPSASVTDAAVKIVFAPLGSGSTRRLRVAGFAELVGDDMGIPPERIDGLLTGVDRVFGLRLASHEGIRPWAGQRPATPTGLPVIGRVGAHRNVFVNSGQGALGFTLAFGSAEQLAEAVRAAA